MKETAVARFDLNKQFVRNFSLAPDYFSGKENSKFVFIQGHFQDRIDKRLDAAKVKDKIRKENTAALQCKNEEWKMPSSGKNLLLKRTCTYVSDITDKILPTTGKQYDIILDPWDCGLKSGDIECLFLGFDKL